MTLEDQTTVDDTAQDRADFGAGFTGKDAEKPTEKPDKPTTAETPRTEEVPAPEHVQITRKEWDEVRAAAAKTASYDSQLSKLFGTTGNIQKLINGLQSQTPRGFKVEVPKESFSKLQKDFPELAEAVQEALSGIKGTGTDTAEVDDTKLTRMLAEHSSAREVEALEDAHPDWRDIVGAVDVAHQKPDQNNPFRKWLAGKDSAYQARINGSESAAVIGRAIGLFQKETAAPAKPQTTQADNRRAVIQAAVQPRGDSQGRPSEKSDEDEFEAGFRSR